MKSILLLLLALILSAHTKKVLAASSGLETKPGLENKPGLPKPGPKPSLEKKEKKVLVASGLQTTHIMYPFNSVPRLDPTHNRDRPDYIGYGAKWVWRNAQGEHVPEDDTILVESIFYSECKTGNLTISSDDQFTADVNFRSRHSGFYWQNIYEFQLKNLKVGWNVLHIVARNKPKSAAGLIYAITQQCIDLKSIDPREPGEPLEPREPRKPREPRRPRPQPHKLRRYR